MHGPGRGFAPTLGVTGVLAALWLLAALAWGPAAPAAVALDPGHAGSIAGWWAAILLTGTTLLAAAAPSTRPLALALVALSWSEISGLHAAAADALAAALDAPWSRPWLKAGAAGLLGASVLAAVPRSPRRSHGRWFALTACAIGGCTAAGLDLVNPGVDAWLAAAEEWTELGIYSVLAGWLLLNGNDTSHNGMDLPSHRQLTPTAM